MIKQRRHSVLPFYLQGCVTKCKTDIRYDMFWYSIRIYKVLIALQSMAPCGFIDGLRKNSDVPGHDRCCGFCICIYQPPALPAPGGATATTATHQHQQQKQQHSHKSNSDSNRRKQQRTNSSNFRILDFRFLISDFGLVYSSFSFWQPQTVRWGFGFRVLDLQFLPKFGFCMRYTRPRGFGSARIYSNASFV